MNNFDQNGESLPVTAPADVSSGDGVQVGQIFGVAATDAESGDPVNVFTCGVYELPKTSAQAWTVGQPIYWDNTNGRADSSASTGMFIGLATAVAANPSSTGKVKLTAQGATGAGGGAVRQVRKRFTVAEVNAGATILPATSGVAYRLVDAAAIAIGGAASAVTTVDILGTQSSSGVKLVAFAQASLTQNTLLRAGASGGTILAAGASFTSCDANTALTIGKTGSDVATATSIDVLVSYAVEQG